MKPGSNALIQIIHDEISTHEGAISFARFMELALYHPEFGYYNKKDFTLGKDGDFITAPEISPLFAHCFARLCQVIFKQLESKNILEMGAGTGQFAADLLYALAQLKALPQHYFIYEKSKTLIEKQKKWLKSLDPELAEKVVWVTAIPDDFEGIMIANEVLDALPVHLFRVEKEIKERVIVVQNGELAWGLKPVSAELMQPLNLICKQHELSDHYQSEINLELPKFVKNVTNALKKGVILFADYGYGQKEYYHPERINGTLTCFYQHAKHENPLFSPGSQDITAHVDFTTVAETAFENGCDLAGFVTQAGFLLNLGLMELAQEAEKNLSDIEAFKLHQAIKILTWPTEMGERIKVMGLSKNIELPISGFNFQDRRRDL